eukprot:TRINITY_DN4083_c0_g1_i1.p1 TRINITY_DN4083_c0_g1~~TRINITY_DN4083_c0_g1_i1.p1  ORF type:complete len:109 (-),score=12.12 TRINITY_DN4083_c0_g1_i1:517-843(-)
MEILPLSLPPTEPKRFRQTRRRRSEPYVTWWTFGETITPVHFDDSFLRFVQYDGKVFRQISLDQLIRSMEPGTGVNSSVRYEEVIRSLRTRTALSSEKQRFSLKNWER